MSAAVAWASAIRLLHPEESHSVTLVRKRKAGERKEIKEENQLTRLLFLIIKLIYLFVFNLHWMIFFSRFQNHMVPSGSGAEGLVNCKDPQIHCSR